MKTYQSVLPAAMRKACRDQQEKAASKERIKASLAKLFTNGFWYCRAHEGACERIESDHGQPATCDRCGSCHIEWNPPIWSHLIDDSKVIQPEDLKV